MATYETGRGNPIDAVVYLICREFNVNEIWLRTGEGEMFEAAPKTVINALVKEYHLNDVGRFIMEKYLNLPESSRAAFEAQLKKIFDEWAALNQPAQRQIDDAGNVAAPRMTLEEIDAETEKTRQALLEKNGYTQPAAAQSSTDIMTTIKQLQRQNEELTERVKFLEKEADMQDLRDGIA